MSLSIFLTSPVMRPRKFSSFFRIFGYNANRKRGNMFDMNMAAVIMMEYKEARARYIEKLRKINERIMLQKAMVLFFRPTTHKETDR